MIDDREPRDPSLQAAIIGAGFAGALLGGAVVWCLRTFRAGDEPPIRVKGGSLHLDIGGTATWVALGSDGTKWKLSQGTRGKEEYDVSIVSTGTGCMNKGPKGKKVVIEYSDGRSVEIKAPGKNTMVTASARLTLENADQRLTFSGSGHVTKLEVDSDVCRFGSGEFDHALLTDF